MNPQSEEQNIHQNSSEEIICKRIYSLLGLAARAGKVCSGNFQTEEAVRRKKAALVIVAADAGPNTSDLFKNKCAYYKVPLVFFGNKEDLGRAIGREKRSSLALTDAGFAGSFKKLQQQYAAGKEM